MTKADGQKNLHEGHRKRMMERFLREGTDGFAEHEIMEIYLFNVLPRTDTNKLAHRLIDHFGSFAAVCDAPMASLMQVEGVGERTAAYLKMLPNVVRTYCISQVKNLRVVNSTEKAGALLMPYFIGRTNEELLMLSLDSAGKVLGITTISKGSLDHASIDIRKMLETVMMYRATKVILAHNHPRSVALPSQEDIACTRRIARVLELINVSVLDHLIFSYALDESQPMGEYVSIIGYTR